MSQKCETVQGLSDTNLRRCRGAGRPQTPCGRTSRCVPRSDGGNSEESPAPPGCHGRRLGDRHQWGRGRSVLSKRERCETPTLLISILGDLISNATLLTWESVKQGPLFWCTQYTPC